MVLVPTLVCGHFLMGTKDRLHGCRQREARLKRNRMAMGLLAVGPAGQLAGMLFVCMVAPDALLPPPFPTRRPQRFYAFNIAVAQAWRGRGVARALLTEAERLGRVAASSGFQIRVDRMPVQLGCLSKMHRWCFLF